MPVSKKRNTNKNSGPTKSKKISAQMSDVSGPSPRWFVVTMSSLMIIGVLLIVLNLPYTFAWVSLKVVSMEWARLYRYWFFYDNKI